MIEIYEQEKKDGLGDLLIAKSSLSFDCEVKPATLPGIAKASVSDPDVFYIESILASVGWNLNDDVFTREEIWNARNTPVHKKFNYMHNEKDIIGTITKAFVLDKDGGLIDDDTDLNKLPEFFEIGVGSVIYSHWEDADLKARARKLIEEIADGKWFVSMEVLFPKFDYSVSKGSENYVIERNEESSFLTKYLKSYGGAGEYQGYKIGRQLKNIFFSGKGLVDNPGNKRSLITRVGFNGAKASLDTFKEVKMSVEQKDYDKAVADLGAAKLQLETAKAQHETLDQKVVSLTGDLEAAKALSAEKTEKITKLEADLVAATAKLQEVNSTLASVLEQSKTKERINKLVVVGVESAKAEQLVKTFASASDEMFAEVVALNTKAAASQETEVEKTTEKLEGATAEKSDVVQTATKDADDLIAKATAGFKDHFQKAKK